MQLLGAFRRDLLIVSGVTSTPEYCWDVRLLPQKNDVASHVFCAHSADLLQSVPVEYQVEAFPINFSVSTAKKMT